MIPVTPKEGADTFDSPDGRTYSGPVTGATPGQAVHAARLASARARLGLSEAFDETWEDLTPEQHADEEAGAQAAIGWRRAEDAAPTAEDFDHAADVISGRAATPGQAAEPSLGQVYWDAYSGNPLQWKHLGELTQAAAECGAQAVRVAVIAAQDARPTPGDDAGTATAVYLEAIGTLSAGLRDIRDADPGAPAGGYARDRAVLALNLADHVQPPAQPAPGCPDPSQHRDVYGRPLPRAEPAPGDPSVLDITGEVLTAAVQGKRIMLQLGSKRAPELATGEVVHLSPRDATYVTPCCGQTPFDLKRTDRMTNDPSLVTCGGPETKPAPELRTCYCGTTAAVVPGVFPHSDCDGSVEARPAPDLAADMAALATQMHAEADAARYAIEAAALHECASRIRLALGPDATREALEGK